MSEEPSSKGINKWLVFLGIAVTGIGAISLIGWLAGDKKITTSGVGSSTIATEKTIDEFERLLEKAESLKSERKFQEANTYYEESYRIIVEIDPHHFYVGLLATLWGPVLLVQKNHKKCDEIVVAGITVLEEYRKIEDSEELEEKIAELNGTLAEVKLRLDEVDAAFACATKARDFFNVKTSSADSEDLPKYKMGLGMVLLTIAEVYEAQGEFEKGLSNCDKSLSALGEVIRQEEHPVLLQVAMKKADLYKCMRREKECCRLYDQLIRTATSPRSQFLFKTAKIQVLYDFYRPNDEESKEKLREAVAMIKALLSEEDLTDFYRCILCADYYTCLLPLDSTAALQKWNEMWKILPEGKVSPVLLYSRYLQVKSTKVTFKKGDEGDVFSKLRVSVELKSWKIQDFPVVVTISLDESSLDEDESYLATAEFCVSQKFDKSFSKKLQLFEFPDFKLKKKLYILLLEVKKGGEVVDVLRQPFKSIINTREVTYKQLKEMKAEQDRQAD